jgi:hypothetical protein
VTQNPANEPAITLLKEYYDICKAMGDRDHMFAISNCLNALRATPFFVDNLEKASLVPYINSGTMGSFVVEASN